MIKENSGAHGQLKYEKLYDWGKSLITSGVIKNHEKFMSENLLQKKFGYSRQTVRAALSRLEADGLITRVRGSGTYVTYSSQDTEGKPHVGLILSYLSDYLFPYVYDGIVSAMGEAGYETDVAVTRNQLNDEALFLEQFLCRNVSGLIIEGTRSSFPNPNIRLYREIRRRQIPTLFIHNHYINEQFNSVEMMDAPGAYQITERLIKNGHRRIAGIFKYDDMQGIERYKGYVECLSDYGAKYDDDWVYWYSTKDMKEKLGKKGLARFYQQMNVCTAIIAYNDEVASFLIDFLMERGLAVPDDISMVSFDDTGLRQDGGVKLVSVVHPKCSLGRVTGKNLLRMMDDADWQNHNYSYCFPLKVGEGNSVLDIRNR